MFLIMSILIIIDSVAVEEIFAQILTNNLLEQMVLDVSYNSCFTEKLNTAKYNITKTYING